MTATLDSLETPPAPAPAPRTPRVRQPTSAERTASRKKVVSGLNKTTNDVGSISLPKFTSDTGAVVMLIVLNVTWSVLRTYAQSPNTAAEDAALGPASVIHSKLTQVVTGAWVVGLGLLIVHEIDPHVAMLMAVLILVGNVLANNAGNKALINALNAVFVGKKGGQ